MHNPGITIEQARALDALERCGTFTAAAKELRRGHTSILYALGTLEDALGFPVLDRSGYRTKLTARGRAVLVGCRALLAAESALAVTIEELRAGWEPALTVVFDGIVPIDPLLHAVGRLVGERVPTQIDVRAEFLAGVEEAFERTAADLMIAVLPPRDRELASVELRPLPVSLVAHADHPLARGRHDEAALRGHLLLTVRGSDPRLHLSTGDIEPTITFRLNDFHAKKAGLLAGLGYGWMPEHLVENELKKRVLVPLRWRGAEVHVFEPRLYYRGGRPLGRAARLVVDRLKADARRTRAG